MTEIAEGYQQTVIGIITQDWDIGNLKQFWNVTDCKHLTAEFIEVGIPVASIREVQSRFVELKNAKKTTEAYYLELIEGGRKPQPGDLIFSRNATVGEVAQVAEWHPPFAMGQDVCLLRKKQPEFSSDYLQAIIQSPIVLKQLVDLMVGSTFKRVNVEQIRNLIVPMPSSKEQKAIAQALSDVDTAIAEIDRLITKKRNIKQGTMQQLLTGKRRLAGFSKQGVGMGIEQKIPELYKLTNVGEIPKDWAVDFITKYCQEIFLGLTSKVDYVGQGGVPLIRATDISNGKLSFRNALFISNQQHKQLIKYRKARLGDILVSKSGSLGVCALVNIDKEFSIYESIIVLQPIQKKLDPSFLLYLMRFQDTQKRLLGETVGSTVGHLNLNNFKQLEIPVPSLPEQKAIAQVLTDMDTEIEALEQKRNKYKAIKQGMMQELLTGRTRLV